MNILHMKYAYEVARAGSLSKAAEELLIAGPNISRSIKELEADLGITIFERTTRGMTLTPEGEEFMRYAKGILSQIEEVEKIYRDGVIHKQKFSISAPRAGYIANALAQFSKTLDDSPAEIFYRETNSRQTIENVVEHDYNLGIIRYAEKLDKYYKNLLDEKNLTYELVAEFSHVLLMHRDCPLAQKEEICAEDLTDYIVVAHADPHMQGLPLTKIVDFMSLSDNAPRHIYTVERASQLEVLASNPNTFMWASSTPAHILERYDLVQKPFVTENMYKDMLIYRKGYKLSALDRQFITELCEARRRYIKD